MVVQGALQLRAVEQRAARLLGVAHEALVGAEAGAGRPSQLPAGMLLLLRQQFHAARHQLVVLRLAEVRRRLRVAGRRLEDR